MEAQYNDFIGFYPHKVPLNTCNKVIQYYEELVKLGKNYGRSVSNGGGNRVSSLTFKDSSVNIGAEAIFEQEKTITLNRDNWSFQVLSEDLAQCVNHYIDTYDSLDSMHLMPVSNKIQKTLPTEGYHIWHCEQNAGKMNRVLAYTVYLNDVEIGGETEFLYQSLRYPATAGTVCIFPAHFTHPHRGNPPLSGEKYIMTGWMEVIDHPSWFDLVPAPAPAPAS